MRAFAYDVCSNLGVSNQNSLIAFLFSKCNCIQHFKLDNNRNWAINLVLMSKNKNVKLKNA